MTQIRWECPNRTLHDSYLLDLPRLNRRGFSRAHNHHDAARTSPRCGTAPGARNTCRRRAAWLHRGDIARPWVYSRYVSPPGPRRGRHGASADHEGGEAEGPVCPHDDQAQTIATTARRPISGLSAQERADLAGVGFLRGLVAMASRGPGPHPAFVLKGPGLRYRNSDKLQKATGPGP
jgi:hypothetical protein